jgi:nucleolar protein 53
VRRQPSLCQMKALLLMHFHSIPQKPLELVLPDELQDSLRLLKPEGNLLGDRFRNLLVQGKLEARKPISQPKKAKRTFTEKWTYKDFKIEP